MPRYVCHYKISDEGGENEETAGRERGWGWGTCSNKIKANDRFLGDCSLARSFAKIVPRKSTTLSTLKFNPKSKRGNKTGEIHEREQPGIPATFLTIDGSIFLGVTRA